MEELPFRNTEYVLVHLGHEAMYSFKVGDCSSNWKAIRYMAMCILINQIIYYTSMCTLKIRQNQFHKTKYKILLYDPCPIRSYLRKPAI